MTLDTARLRTIEQVEAFMQGTLEVGFSPPSAAERYPWIGRSLNQFAYPTQPTPTRAAAPFPGASPTIHQHS